MAAMLTERAKWFVHNFERFTLAIGTPLFVVWTEEDKNTFNKKGQFTGDIRIAKKLRVENKNTIFVFKDGTTRTVPTVDVKRLMIFSNQVLQSSQVSQVFAKKSGPCREC